MPRSPTTPANPVIICVRGPSRSGKTTLCERLIAPLAARGWRVGFVKRTHHPLDLPEKASGRIWARRPAAMLLASPDRLQLTFPPADGAIAGLVAALPAGLDVVLVETHSPEDYPTLVNTLAVPVEGEEVLGRWDFASIELASRHALHCIEGMLRERVPGGAPRDIAHPPAIHNAAFETAGGTR